MAKKPISVHTKSSELWRCLYLGLGVGRSLRQLFDSAGIFGVKPPVMSTLEKWSARDGWVADAAEFDERTRATGEVIELTVDAVTHANQRKAKITSTIIDDSYQMWLDAKKKGIPLAPDKIPGVLSTVFKDEAMALGAATERHEVAISFADDAAPQIAQLFISVNMIHDPEMRAAQFAEGMNDLARRFVNAQR